MQKTATILTRADHGRRMPLGEFDHATSEDGRLYELSRGVITMIDVPGRKHLATVNALKRQIHAYDGAHTGVIHTIATGSECKLSIVSLDSERHPDLAIYKTPSPAGTDFWQRWVPEIVVEIVSHGGDQRDYVEKREEYLQFGIEEYWILDAHRRQMLVLTRVEGQWAERIITPSEKYSSALLPGMYVDCAAIFAAADAVPS
jgi:Uma2 family endonuclease